MPSYDYTAKALQLPIGGVNKLIELKDAVARAATVGGTHYKGVTTTELADGASTNPITIGGASYTAVNGDIVVVDSTHMELIYATSDNKWHEFGDLSDIQALGFVDSAEGDITPAGSFSGFGVTLSTETGKYVMDDPTTDGGEVDAGTADSLTMSVDVDTLVIGWSAGSPTDVTLPTFTHQNIVYGVASVTDPTFSGTPQTVTVAPAE